MPDFDAEPDYSRLFGDETSESPPEQQSARKVVGIGTRIRTVVSGLFWLGVVGTIFTFVGREAWRDIHRWRTYQPAEATVVTWEPASYDSDLEETKRGWVTYRWLVAGTEHSAKQPVNAKGIAWVDPGDMPHEAVLEPGDTLTVWHDPANPDEHTRDPRPEPFPLGALIFVTPFVLVGITTITTGLFGDPTGRTSRTASAPQSGADANASRNRDWAGAYFLISAVTAFGFFFASAALHWTTAWILGLVLWLGVVPLIVALITRIRRAGRRAIQPESGQSESPQPAGKRATSPTVQPPAQARRGLAAAELADDISLAPTVSRGERKGIALLILVGLFWCGLTGAAMGVVIHGFYMSHVASTRFVATEGKVLGSKIVISDTDDGVSHEPWVKYEYAVDGKTYTSKNVSYGGDMSSSEHSHARSIVGRYPAGEQVTVLYDPSDPSEAVLEAQASPMLYMFALFLQPFVVVGLGMIAAAIHIARTKVRRRRFAQCSLQDIASIPTWGPIRHEGPGRCVIQPGGRLGQTAVALAMGYGLTCFVSIFVVVFLLGGFGTPNPWHIRVAFLIAGAVGLIAALRTYAKRPDRPGLVLDVQTRRVALIGRSTPLDVSLADMRAWTLRDVPNPHPSSTRTPLTTGKAPLLCLLADDGTEHVVHVFPAEGRTPLVAAKAARWLAEQTHLPVWVSADSHYADASRLVSDDMPFDAWPHHPSMLLLQYV